MPRDATARPDPLEELADALHSASIHLLRRLRREDDATGLTPARLSALSVVVFGGPMRISDLARTEQVRTPTITPIIAALETDGLVVREADPRDARAWILRATPKGQKLTAQGRARRVARLAAQLRDVPAGDRAILRRAAVLMQELARKDPA
ncbi:MAG TPA: MarR family transcriptional regulator [Vicinamibacterales bacterium]|nr:MarR family transcriptional regulator [Vicinamibacterales bacterium]